MGDTNYIIDPDNGVGTDYVSLSAWESDADDLGDPGDTNTATCRSSSGTADTTLLVIATWQSGVYCKIVADDGHEALKTGIDTDRYRLQVGDDIPLDLQINNLTLIGLQILNTSAAQFKALLHLDPGTSTACDVLIQNCYLKDLGGNYNADGIYHYRTSSGTSKIENTILVSTGTSGNRDGYLVSSSNWTVDIYNSIADNWSNGFYEFAGTLNAVNCASFDNSDDFNITNGSIDNCASDDGDGNDPVAPSGLDWDNEFNDPSNGDYTLLNSGNLYDAGLGPTADADVPTTDIDGDTRSGATCDIGPDEYSAGGEPTLPVFMRTYRNRRA